MTPSPDPPMPFSGYCAALSSQAQKIRKMPVVQVSDTWLVDVENPSRADRDEFNNRRLHRSVPNVPSDLLPGLSLDLELDGWQCLSDSHDCPDAARCGCRILSGNLGRQGSSRTEQSCELSLRAALYDFDVQDFFADWTWRLLAVDGSVLRTSPEDGTRPLYFNTGFPFEMSYKCKDFNAAVLRDAKRPDGTLAIRIDLRVSVPQIVQNKNAHLDAMSSLQRKLKRKSEALRQANVFRAALASIYRNKTHSDFTIHVRGHDFAVHRNVLAERSPVFAAMFEQEMKEKASNHVTLDDTTPEAMKTFLEAVYGDENSFLHSTKESMQDALYLANKYSIADVKRLCDVRLASFVNESNAMAVLMETAALCDARATTAKCVRLLCDHVTWLESSDWLDFKAAHSRLASGIVSELTKRQRAIARKHKRLLAADAARGRARNRENRKEERERDRRKRSWTAAGAIMVPPPPPQFPPIPPSTF